MPNLLKDALTGTTSTPTLSNPPLQTHTADDWQLLESHTGELSTEATFLREWRKRMQMRACRHNHWGDVAVRATDGLCAPLLKDTTSLAQLFDGLQSVSEDEEEPHSSSPHVVLNEAPDDHTTQDTTSHYTAAFDALPSPPPALLQPPTAGPPPAAKPPFPRYADLPKLHTGAFLEQYKPNLDNTMQLLESKCAEALVAVERVIATAFQQRRAQEGGVVPPAVLARLNKEVLVGFMTRDARALVRQVWVFVLAGVCTWSA